MWFSFFNQTITIFRPQDTSAFEKNLISTKTCVVGTQKNHLNEMVLLKTQNTCLH